MLVRTDFGTVFKKVFVFFPRTQFSSNTYQPPFGTEFRLNVDFFQLVFFRVFPFYWHFLLRWRNYWQAFLLLWHFCCLLFLLIALLKLCRLVPYNYSSRWVSLNRTNIYSIIYFHFFIDSLGTYWTSYSGTCYTFFFRHVFLGCSQITLSYKFCLLNRSLNQKSWFNQGQTGFRQLWWLRIRRSNLWLAWMIQFSIYPL